MPALFSKPGLSARLKSCRKYLEENRLFAGVSELLTTYTNNTSVGFSSRKCCRVLGESVDSAVFRRRLPKCKFIIMHIGPGIRQPRAGRRRQTLLLLLSIGIPSLWPLQFWIPLNLDSIRNYNIRSKNARKKTRFSIKLI